MSDLTGQVLEESYLSLLYIISPKKDSGFSRLNENEKQLANHA